MEDGRQWALRVFDTYGPLIRDRIPELVKAEHEASRDAQDACGHQSKSVYGQFYVGILERFKRFGELPGATLVRPGRAPYRTPVINGVALFPWRFANKSDGDLPSTPFATSDARIALTNLEPGPVQGVLDFALPDPELTDEEREILATLHDVADDPAVTTGRLVLVAIRSSDLALHSVEWGAVKLNQEDHLEWDGFHETLMTAADRRPASTSPTKTFTTGPIPPKFPPSAADAVDTQGDE